MHKIEYATNGRLKPLLPMYIQKRGGLFIPTLSSSNMGVETGYASSIWDSVRTF